MDPPTITGVPATASAGTDKATAHVLVPPTSSPAIRRSLLIVDK
jgi:hypothetical protein